MCFHILYPVSEGRGIEPLLDLEGGGGASWGSGKKSICGGGMKIVGNFYSAAPRQAKEAETDGLSNTSGDALLRFPNRGRYRPGRGDRTPRDRGSPFLVLDFLNNTKYRVEQSKTDEFARKTYRKLPE